ncbi:MAG: CARDB domain-containing protein [Halobacteriales archaeon]
MASASVSHMVIFIASMIIAASVVGTFTTQVSQVSNALDDQALDVSEKIRTDIEVISDSGSEVYDSSTNNITIHVKNTGSRTLSAETSEVSVLLDGQLMTTVSITIVDGSEWQAGDVIEITFDTTEDGNLGESLDTGDHRIKVIVTGNEDVFRFRNS